ncbi:MAG: TonB-dependent receptor [Bacteroidia bacterium]|nr:TonB-dependent receptor [Bacteroidia bacterium]
MIGAAYLPAQICLLALCLQASISFAQVQKIDTVQFNVVNSFKPVISDAVKLNDNPATDTTRKVKKQADYNNLINARYPTQFYPSSLDAMYMRGEPLDKLQRSCFMGGIGNYNTLYGEYFFNSLRSRNFDYGIHLNHFSSQDLADNNAFSGFAYNDINIYGETFLPKHTLYAQADFDNQIVHDFGYNRSADVINNNDSTRVNYNKTAVAVDYKSNYKDSSGLNHNLYAAYNNFTNVLTSSTYRAAENIVNLKAHAYSYFDEQRIDVKASADYYDDNSLQGNTNTWNFKFNPYFTGSGKTWDARLGLKLFYDIQNGVNLYPDFLARYHIAHDAVMLYAGADGDKTYNSYEMLAGMNPFMQDTSDKKYTFTKIHLYGGLSGTITNNLTYNLSGAQSIIDNMPLFMTNINEPLMNRFMVVYDNVRELDIHGDVDYKAKKDWNFVLGADYYVYNADSQKHVWYHPDFVANLLGQYTIRKKWTLKLQAFVLGPQYAPSPVMVNGITTVNSVLDNAYPDLNIGVDYHHNNFLTIFLNLNNLANIQYQRWLNYPTQGFNAMVGVRLTF